MMNLGETVKELISHCLISCALLHLLFYDCYLHIIRLTGCIKYLLFLQLSLYDQRQSVP